VRAACRGRERCNTGVPASVDRLEAEMKTTTAMMGLLIGALAAALVACQQGSPAQRDLCPTGLQATPVAEKGAIGWGPRKSPKVQAWIVSVAVECFPAGSPGNGSGAAKHVPVTGYQIAATANVIYEIHDSKWLEALPLGLTPAVIFEAVSANGVVLASKEGELRIVPGGDGGTVSATISGLSGPEIQRVSLVQARWRFGR
jgi:hypothetical protein